MLAKISLISKLYSIIVIIALILDLLIFKGNSGSLMIATLPISVIAMYCFIAGQFSKKISSKKFFYDWVIGCVLVLLGYFSYLTKDSELIFTYAMLISSPPASIVLGLTPNIASGFSTSALISRALLAWSICITVASFQWLFVQWLLSKKK